MRICPRLAITLAIGIIAAEQVGAIAQGLAGRASR